jgi:glutathione peroxidase
MQSIYDLSIKAINSDDYIDLSEFKGKFMLLVNVASKCGFTPQYKQLQKVYEENSRDLVIVGFPCNQFLWQENGSETKIESFCKTEYGVTFPVTEKVQVKGKNQHPIFKWLTTKELNAVGNFKVSWNFNKFLIDRNGSLIAQFGSKTLPDSDDILKNITSQ